MRRREGKNEGGFITDVHGAVMNELHAANWGEKEKGRRKREGFWLGHLSRPQWAI